MFLYAGTEESINKYNQSLNSSGYAIDEGNTDTSWIDIYMKPISTKFGDFGFGYKSIEQTESYGGENITVLDAANSANNNYLPQ